MLLSWKWLTPVLLRFLSLPHVSLASAGAALRNGGSVHLVSGFYVGIAASPTDLLPPPQPRLNLSLDGTTFIELASHELALPIMPLHLLGKKSWNVYNQVNIDKVKRDEAVAQAKEDAEDERLQEIDSARRIAILRGEEEPLALPPAPPSPSTPALDSRSHGSGPGRERKKRKRVGEDDTDFEMRLASEQTASSSTTETQLILRRPVVDAPLTDRAGHIDLFPRVAGDASAVPDVDARKAEEVAKRKKEYERDYTVKFSDAAGFKQGLQQPWYSKGGEEEETEASRKDVWGNEDPRRRERQAARVVSSDPLAMMKQGAAKVRQVEKERKRWAEERERERLDLERAEKERRKRRRRHRNERGDDDLEGFSLEGGEDRKEHRSRGSDSTRRDHRHRDRSQDRERQRRHRRH